MSETLLVLTPGDPDGIGPEITWSAIKKLFQEAKHRDFSILCVGAREPFEELGIPLHIYIEKVPIEESIKNYRADTRDEPKVWLYPAPTSCASNLFLPGFQAGWSIETATNLVLNKKASALVTGPINKDRLQKGGYLFPGHTEFLASLCDTPEVTMMLANDKLRVSLVTTHLSLKTVSEAITREKIRKTVIQTKIGLTQLWGIPRPRIAVTSLNPHGGENGLFGREEIETICPTLEELRMEYRDQMVLQGPFPADTFFALQQDASKLNSFDAVVCMYHDQGLIPVKLLDFRRTVNITLGLPIIRTSVDHGVGFDIARKGRADSSSLYAAIELAFTLIQRNTR